jgi:NAD(P)-dependent dehydrogenase (short-subunit alcohol dehydrogenase family)
MTRTAIITGAGGGLAQATARLLAEAGWSLALVGRDRDALEAVQEDLTEHAPEPARSIKIVLVKADVATGEGAVRALSTAREMLEEPVQSLINCAGGDPVRGGQRVGEAQYRRILAANLDTAFFTLGAFLDQADEDRVRGSAVLVSSVVPPGPVHQEATATAREAIEALVRSAAATYAPRGMRVNAVAPDLMPRPMTLRFFGDAELEPVLAEQYPLGRWSDVLDTARSIRWLLGDESAWINGHVLPIGAGLQTSSGSRPVAAQTL